MIREIKNWWGNLQGYGCCYDCGDRWSWKEMQVINYSSHGGIFPLCKVCFAELDEEEILEWCKILLANNYTCVCKLKRYTKRLTKEIKKLKGGKK